MTACTCTWGDISPNGDPVGSVAALHSTCSVAPVLLRPPECMICHLSTMHGGSGGGAVGRISNRHATWYQASLHACRCRSISVAGRFGRRCSGPHLQPAQLPVDPYLTEQLPVRLSCRWGHSHAVLVRTDVPFTWAAAVGAEHRVIASPHECRCASLHNCSHVLGLSSHVALLTCSHLLIPPPPVAQAGIARHLFPRAGHGPQLPPAPQDGRAAAHHGPG